MGRLRSPAPDAVFAPRTWAWHSSGAALVRRGARTSVLELHHTLVPRRPLPEDAPSHELSPIAVHAIAGALAEAILHLSVGD